MISAGTCRWTPRPPRRRLSGTGKTTRPCARWGLFTNKLLLAGIAVALAFAAAVVYLPALHGLFDTAALSPGQLAIVAPFPVIVWGADEIRRTLVRRRLGAARLTFSLAEADQRPCPSGLPGEEAGT